MPFASSRSITPFQPKAWRRWRARTLPDGPRSTQRPERGADLLTEELRLLPGGEVAALVDLVVIDEVGIRLLRPTPWRLILLAGKDAHGHRDGDALGIEEASFVLPIETRGRDPGVRQPIERDVVEDLVTRQFARSARGPVQSRHDRRGRLAVSIVVVEKPGGQADGGIRDAVQRLRARCHE